jgi:hypothetical protein
MNNNIKFITALKFLIRKPFIKIRDLLVKISNITAKGVLGLTLKIIKHTLFLLIVLTTIYTYYTGTPISELFSIFAWAAIIGRAHSWLNRTLLDNYFSNISFTNLNISDLPNVSILVYKLYLYSIFIILFFLTINYFTKKLNPALILIKGETSEERIERIRGLVLKNIQKYCKDYGVDDYMAYLINWFTNGDNIFQIRDFSTKCDLRLAFIFGPFVKLAFKISTTFLLGAIVKFSLERLLVMYVNKTHRLIYRYLTIEFLVIDKDGNIKNLMADVQIDVFKTRADDILKARGLTLINFDDPETRHRLKALSSICICVTRSNYKKSDSEFKKLLLNTTN